MLETKNILQIEECEIIEELNQSEYNAGFLAGTALVVGAVVLVAT